MARYALAAVCVIGSFLAALLFDGLLPPATVFLTGVVLAAWFGGLGAGLLAAVLSTITIDYFFIPPLYQWTLSVARAPALLVFALSATFISWASAKRRMAEESLKAARDSTRIQIRERTAELERANQQLSAEIAERQRVENALRRSEERWRAVFENNPTMYFMVDAGGSVVSVNPFGAAKLGYTVEELIGQPVLKVFHDEDRDAVRRNVEQCLNDFGKPMSWELRKVRKDGAVIWVRETARAMRTSDNETIVLVACEDVTERKRAEDELRKSEQRLSAIVANAPVGLFAVDRSGSFTLLEGRGFDALGLQPGELVGQSIFQLYREVPQVVGNIRRGLAGDSFTDVVQVNDRTFETHYVPVVDEQDEVAGVNGVAIDITERRRAEADLRASEGRHRHIFQATGVSIWEEDFSRVKAAVDEVAQGVHDFREYLNAHPEFVHRALSLVRVVDVNEATVRLFGARTKEELLVSLDRVFTAETLTVFAGELVALAEGRTTFESETVMRTLQGDEIAVLFTITFPPPPSALETVLVSITDITERKRAEEALQRQANLLEQTHDAIFVWEFPRTIIYWNRGAEQLYGFSREEALGRRAHELLYTDHPVAIPAFEAALERDGEWTGELGHTTRDGRKIIVDSRQVLMRTVDGRRLVLETNRDITERKRTEQALEDLAGRLIHAQEEERSRIGRELHDHISQRLGVLAIKMDQLRADGSTSSVVREALDSLRQDTSDVTSDVHRLSHRLHSSMLDHLGLVPALHRLVTEMSERHDIRVEFAHAPLPAGLRPEVTLCLFRIAEESLTNVVKHSGARSARVDVGYGSDGIRLVVADAGHGFDAGLLESKAGLGFVSMRERLRLVHGTMHVRSTPHGTTLDVCVPPAAALGAPSSTDVTARQAAN
jgi:PAS domain S-box-containing protein